MLVNYLKVGLFIAVPFIAAACEKDNDRCNCVEANGESSIVTVEDQECSDISTTTVKCYPAD